jgi:ABC-2 type transport system permease protein
MAANRAASLRTDELQLPDFGGTGKPVSGLRRFADITLTLSRADFKLRYLDSIIGYVWSLIQPLLLFLVMWFVWTELFPHTTDVPHYDVMLLLGIALFTFFSEATGAALTSLVSKGEMLRKIPFPPVALPLSSVLTSFYVYSFTLVIVLGFILANGVTPSFLWLEMIPVMLLLLVFTGGLALLLSFLYVTIRDVEQVWLVIQRMMFFITPVFFPIEFAPAGLQNVLMLNPLAVVTVQARHALIDPSAPTALEAGGPAMIAGAFAITGAIVAAGLFLYRKRVDQVAERI